MFFVKGGTGFYVPPGGSVTGKSYWGKKDLFVVGKGYVNHPGTDGHEFIYEAADKIKDQVKQLITDSLENALTKARLK